MESPVRHLPAAERKRLIVEAVIALAAETNPDQIATAAIAQRMNLTHGALFRHFPNKEAIWEAVMSWVADRLLARVDRAIGSQPSPLGAMEAVFLAHVGFVVEHPGIPRMLFGELQRGEDTPAKRMTRALLERYTARLVELIEGGKSAGEVDVDIDPKAAAVLFIGSVQGLVMQSLLAGNVGRMRQAAPGVFALYRRGVAACGDLDQRSTL